MNIYFIVSSGHDFIKIGTSTLPYRRFNQLAKEAQPLDIYMIYVKDSPFSEYSLHKRFSSLRKCKEWFWGHNKLYETIQKLYDDYGGIIISAKYKILKIIEPKIIKEQKVDLVKEPKDIFKLKESGDKLTSLLLLYNQGHWVDCFNQ